MFKFLGNKQVFVKFISIILFFTTFVISEIHAEEDGNDFIDYVSIYNQKNKPIDYKEGDNAASYYQKAIAARIKPPSEIKYDYWCIWPGDLSKQNLQTMKQWIKSNSLALEYFAQASQKSYFWTEKKSNGSMLGILLPDLAEIRNLTYLTRCRAMLEAMDGNIENAAKDIETIYRVGNHFNGPREPIELIIGISLKFQALETVLIIIQNTQIDRKEREIIYNSLKKYIKSEVFTPDISAIKLTCLDCLQRMYILDKDGRKVMDKRLAQRQISLCRIHCMALMYHSSGLIKQQDKSKLVQIDCEKALELITEKFEQLEKVIALEGWQLNETMNQKNGRLQSIQKSHPLLNILASEAVDLKLSFYERLRAETLAMDTIMSVLTFKENKGRLPLNLGELQEAGLLEKLPIDPFSSKPIEYKKLDGNFTVYSHGLDFDNDGGVRKVDFDVYNGDIVVWPVKKYEERLRK